MASHLQNLTLMAYLNCHGAENDTLKWCFEYMILTKPSYNKAILLVPALCISVFFYPDNEKPDITR